MREGGKRYEEGKKDKEPVKLIERKTERQTYRHREIKIDSM